MVVSDMTRGAGQRSRWPPYAQSGVTIKCMRRYGPGIFDFNGQRTLEQMHANNKACRTGVPDYDTFHALKGAANQTDGFAHPRVCALSDRELRRSHALESLDLGIWDGPGMREADKFQ